MSPFYLTLLHFPLTFLCDLFKGMYTDSETRTLNPQASSDVSWYIRSLALHVQILPPYLIQELLVFLSKKHPRG